MNERLHYKDSSIDAMINICLTCKKKECTGVCSRVKATDSYSTAPKFKYNGRVYSLMEVCQLTGYTNKGIRDKFKRLNYNIDSIMLPEISNHSAPKLYECFGLKLRTIDWERLINTSKILIGKRLRNGIKPDTVFKDYVFGRGPVQSDKFKAEFVSSGRPWVNAHMYTNFKISTKESEKDTVKWIFEYLYPKRIPEMNEWLHNINNPAYNMLPDYYYNGYYQILKEDYGYYFSITEPHVG